jgi:hypothetical protein
MGLGGGGGGGGGNTTPPPIPLYPVDLLKTEEAGIKADQFGYNYSDQDFLKRFPGLVAAREADMKKAYDELTGPLDPEVSANFTEQGLAQTFGAFGAGQEAPMLTGEGTIGRNTTAASVANQTQGYQDAARQYMEQLQAENPQRAFGLTGGDLLNLSILNQSNLVNAVNQEKGLQQQLNAANQASSQSSKNALIGVGTSIISAAIPAVISL